MPRTLKVYNYHGVRYGIPKEEDRHGQTCEYIAAPSKAAAAKAFGTNVRHVYRSAYPPALERCLKEPGIVFWYPLASGFGNPKWRRTAPAANDAYR